MAISTTYILLQSQIADELGGRTDLLSTLSGSGLTLSPIKNAIQSAIAKWERTPFYFNEAYDTAFFSTANGTEVYTSVTSTKISTAADIRRLRVTSGTTRSQVIRTDWDELEDISTSTSATGLPTHFAYAASQIRFYPIPDAVYVVGALYTQRLTALSADGDTNAWTQDGFDLIRAEAKLILALEVLHDADMAAKMALAIYGSPGGQGVPATKGYLQVLLEETERRDRHGAVRALDEPARPA